MFISSRVSSHAKDGSTALFKAAFKGHNSVIVELLKFSPSLGLLKVEDATLYNWIAIIQAYSTPLILFLLL